MKAWIDGELVDEENGLVSAMSHTLHYGTGVFEGIRAYGVNDDTLVFRLMDHLERLERSARAMHFDIKFSLEQLRDAVIDVLRHNDLQDAYIRPLIYVGAGSLALNFHASANPLSTMIAARKWDRYFEADGLSGISVVTGIGRRLTSQTELHQAKVAGAYANSYVATMAAQKAGADEAILVDENDCISEASAANIFHVQDGVLYTPTCRTALAGITRDTIILIARQRGLKVCEVELTADDLYGAAEIFLTGTACEVVPVTAVDGKSIGEGAGAGTVGPLTQELHTAYQRTVRSRHSFSSNTWIGKQTIAA